MLFFAPFDTIEVSVIVQSTESSLFTTRRHRDGHLLGVILTLGYFSNVKVACERH